MSENIQVDVASVMSQYVERFVPRQAQQEMAKTIGMAIEQENNVIVEAGTGTGKTFAYLVPMLSSGKKVVISTGTKALQDQLFYKDIPLVNQSYNRRIALLKGRSNYLCPRRLANHLKSISKEVNSTRLNELVYIADWAKTSVNGDLTEILDAGRGADVAHLVTSTVDNCLGHQCEYFDECPLYRARLAANDADVVVVNHHLLFADLALREEASGKLLPEADHVVLDEAHQVADVARGFYGERISSGQFLDLCQDTIQEQLQLGNDDPELIKASDNLKGAISALTNAILSRQESLADLIVVPQVREVIEQVDTALTHLTHRLEQAADRSVGLGRCYSRCIKVTDIFSMLTEPNADFEFAHWLERRERGFTIHLTPIDIASYLQPVFDDKKKQWAFVSATLCIGEKFSHIKQALGLDNVIEAQFASPFNFQNQVCGYVPMHLPEPASKNHTEQMLIAVLPLLRMNQGKSFVLFTSHRALQTAAVLLEREYDLVCLVQGALPKKQLLEKFREIPRCILLATQSFWEGIDVRGAGLRLLVIDKLPFASPDNPLVDAQIQHITANGGNAFRDYSLPEAAITLKQGFGRLIREESDRGLFVLGDTRMMTRNYGKTLQRSLPDMNWLPDEAAALNFFEMLQQ